MSVKKGEIFIDNNHKHTIYIHIASEDDKDGFVKGPMVTIERESRNLVSFKAATVAHEMNVLRVAEIPDYDPAIPAFIKEGV